MTDLPPAELELRPAKFNDRLIAYLLDVAVFAGGYCATMITAAFKFKAVFDAPQFALRVAFLWVGLYLLYQFVGNVSGGTIGKKLMGLRVVARNGRPLGVARSFARALGYLISTPFFNFGFLVALFHPESRALHDMLSGSIVIELRPKHPAEAAILFLAAVGTLGLLYGSMLYLWTHNPTPSDLMAVEKAKEGLQILAQIEEAYKNHNGTYTDNLGELAKASGDVQSFRASMSALFDPNLFQLRAGRAVYQISASARDRRKTRVTIEGPPPRLVP